MNSPQNNNAASVAADTASTQRAFGSSTVYTPTKFLTLFPSRENATALGTPTGQTDDKGKVLYEYTTLRREFTEADVVEHLAGRVSIVAIAILQDNTCQWASLDIDNYLIDADRVWQRCQQLNLPLHLFKSKSGGLHLMAFFREPKPAAAVRRLLASWAELIGVGKVELFPKQDFVDPVKGCGNGMNLPFFGDEATLVSFEPIYCDTPAQEWPKDWPKGWEPATVGEAKGILVKSDWDPEVELEKASLAFTKRELSEGSYSLDYYADHGECLLWEGVHSDHQIPEETSSTYSSVNRQSRFVVQREGAATYLCHQCFDTDCQAKQNKTATALARLGIKVDDITPKLTISQKIESPRGFILTEGGNAERLVSEHKDNFRYLLDDQVWLAWDGRRWKRDATAEIHAAAKATVRHMRHLAADIENDEERKRFSTFCNVSDRRASRENMVALARYEPEVKALRWDFDCHPWLLNVQNGTIDLHSGQLRAHDRADMLTQIAPITYDPSAPCPRWLQFLAETFPDPANKSVKQDVIDFLRRAIGYTLTGETGEHKFWLLLGGGRNGKGVFLNVIKALLGDYAAETSFDTFTAKRADAAAINPRDGLATLVGKRFIKASESSEGKRFDDALVKKVTGGDSVRTAKVYGDEFEYMPQFKIWLATNVEPKVTGVDDGIWSRILRVNFDHQVPEEKRDVQLVAKIVAEELPGILNWALAGLRDYRANGLRVPVAVVGAVSEYRHDQNPLVDFLTARYDRTGAPDDTVPGSELLKDYNEWARMNRARVLTSQALGLATKALEVPSRRAGRDKQTVYSGLKRKTTGPVIGGTFGNAW